MFQKKNKTRKYCVSETRYEQGKAEVPTYNLGVWLFAETVY